MYLLMNLAGEAKQKDSSNTPRKKTVQPSGNIHFHGQFFWWHLVCLHQLIFFIPLGELLQSWSMCFLCKKLIAGSVEFLNTNLRPWTFRSFVRREETLERKLVSYDITNYLTIDMGFRKVSIRTGRWYLLLPMGSLGEKEEN